MGSLMSRPFRSLATVIAVLASVSTFAIYYFQRKLIYPSHLPEGTRVHVDTPDKYGIPYEDVTLNTSDGETLQTYIMCHDEALNPNYVPKTVLMLNPNAGNIGHTLPLAEIIFKRMNYNVVLFSYRGYGLSSGQPSEAGLKTDAKTALEYLQQHSQIKNTSVILYGRSLGGAIAFYTASLGGDFIKAIMVENTFLSIPKVIPNVLPMLAPFTFLCTEEWNTEKLIQSISSQVPVLFLSGGQDELIPPAHMKRLYDLCPSSEKQFEVFPGGMHNDTVIQKGYWAIVHRFLTRNCAPLEVESGIEE